MIGAAIFIGGGLGSLARWALSVWALERFGPSFPIGTLLVNLIGCFALGVVAQFATASSWSPELRGAVAVGVLGGFTTYSTFNHETLSMIATGTPAAALTNVVATVGGGLLAGWLGIVVARQLVA